MDRTAPHVIDMAAPSTIARHAARTLLCASVLPMAAFYLTFALAGLRPAVGVTLFWYLADVAVRVARGHRVVGAVLLGAGLMTLRAVVAMWTGSAFLFFLQPVAGTVATATAFAITALAGRPLLERLAHDFVPVPAELAHRLRARRFFDWTSLIWAAIYGLNAAGTVWLLTYSSLGSFLVLKTVLSPVLTGVALAGTWLVLRRTLRSEGVHLRWAPRA